MNRWSVAVWLCAIAVGSANAAATDGVPDVNTGAAAPRPVHATRAAPPRPDFTGVYRRAGFPTRLVNLDFMMPWVADEVRRRQAALRNGRPIPTNITQCKLTGPLAMWNDAHHIQFIQTADELIVLGETDHQVRRIHLNARHPADLVPTWFGHSIGHWEGDTLVVDTVGFNDKSDLDATGTPHSEALHVVERLRPLPQGKVEVSVTMDDPLALRQPWNLVHQLARQPEPFFEEYACAENNKDGKEIP